ncbi:coiled-coil domain-containing protein 83 isoform X1 [Xenopus laevis]|uniref:Coiled-coil domain-containing protein 83 isoform X1 n=1 Tax=Xenopus laevis TaxID=8355 RepID=A0A8J1MAP8_XENLA|nr:coiled-coil domain-containing protein 83 isoform X1 [Xenopus laevis]XP_041438780.1 coiled-coil domain-containing protein 83 isoform X1 [Xenopus laevis]
MGKKGKKKKNGGPSATGEKKMTFAEALLAYQIEMKESAIEELRAELKQIEEKNARYKERNDHLKGEQTGHVKTLLNEAKAQEKDLANKEVINREQVDAAIREKWEKCRQMEEMLEEMGSGINQLEKEIGEKKMERDYWAEYKNVGSKEHAKQIYLLEAERNNMKQSCTDINGYFSKNLETAKLQIVRETEKLMEEKKELATRNAVKDMDEESQKEMNENDWLKREVAIYRRVVGDLKRTLHRLEQENLAFVNQLFESRLQDLNITRNTFITQVLGMEDPGVATSEHGLSKLQHGTESKSLIVAAIKESVSSLEVPLDADPTSQRSFNLLYEDEKDFEQYLQLGPLEMKLLRLEGQPMPLHQEREEATSRRSHESDDTDAHKRQKWPLSPRTMRSALAQTL